MEHILRLNNNPFCKIKNKTKTIEMRLFDEKRKLLNVGDVIKFINRENNEEITVKIINLYRFKNFAEIYNKFNKVTLGYEEKENCNPKDMEQYYSKEEIEKYGTLAIEIKVINE